MRRPEPLSPPSGALPPADRRGRMAVVLMVLTLSASFRQDLSAQIPEEFHNLQVLPQDIEQRQLVATMRGFALGLGVRCWHCHVGEEGLPFSEWDFPSDEKITKQKARFMLEMVGYLNEDRLPGIADVGERAEPAVRVTCYTCHRGRPLPRTLQEEVASAIAEEGLEAGVARYRELREGFYGQGAYNFGELTLLGVAEQLAGEGRLDDGIEIVKLNLEFFPESGISYFTLAEGYRMGGRREEALQAYRKAGELQPENPIVGRRIQELEGGG